MSAPLDPLEHARADERTLLLAFLDDAREGALESVAGLTDEQARRRLVPSLTTPLSILKHLIHVERVWFQVYLHGRTRAEIDLEDDAAESWVLEPADSLARLSEAYRQACTEAREIVAGYDLDQVVVHRFMGELSLRFVLLHVIRETARHAGHADILCEQVLAADDHVPG